MLELIELCKKLVKFASYNGNTAAALQFVQSLLETSGFTTRIEKYAANGKTSDTLYASYGSGHPHLLFAGHIDVVPPGAESSWQYPPFAATIKNDVLYGRGIADMKGGIACFIQACKDVLPHHKLNGKISLIISTDEEEPVVEGTKKILETLHNEGEKFDFALVGEPTNPTQMGEEIKVGRRGDIVLHITSYGKQGHTAYSAATDNPLYHLINLLYCLQHDTLDNGNQFFAPSTMQITTIDVGNTATNVVPSTARAVIDIRFNSEHTYQSIESWLNKHILNNGGKFDVSAEYVGESFLSPIDDNIKNLQQIVAKYSGTTPQYSTTGGTSDARFVKNYCPVVEYGLTNATI
ncbi:MAG: succinyl-diaminopimelate desuccinylase, partial [Alphaproteobacteria bacterium]|nr:succinyl-diaminopimelate desuccinylase [Alphaproteobacteria bacterium]